MRDNEYCGPISQAESPMRAETTSRDTRACRFCREFDLLELEKDPRIVRIEYFDLSGAHHRHGYNPNLGIGSFEDDGKSPGGGGEPLKRPAAPRIVRCFSCKREHQGEALKLFRSGFCAACLANF